MTGREGSLPLDIMFGSLTDQGKVTAPEYVQRLQSRLKTCFQEVREHLKKFGERQKRYYNLSTHGTAYQPGDMVYLRETTRKKQVSPKLMPKWKGPYLIIGRFGTVYEVMTTFKVSKLYHFDLLKPCHGNMPPWIKRAKRRFLSEMDKTQA